MHHHDGEIVMSVAPLRTGAASAACLLACVIGPVFAQGLTTTMQISPQGGGHCIEVQDRLFAPDQHLQMADCNNSAAQMFAYDGAGMRLTIGGLCVDADAGQPGDLVKLATCRDDAGQIWKVEPKGNFAKLIGKNGLCLDVRYGSTERGALVQSWTCADAAPNQLWSFQRR
jgi:hypothetical protein